MLTHIPLRYRREWAEGEGGERNLHCPSQRTAQREGIFALIAFFLHVIHFTDNIDLLYEKVMICSVFYCILCALV